MHLRGKLSALRCWSPFFEIRFAIRFLSRWLVDFALFLLFFFLCRWYVFFFFLLFFLSFSGHLSLLSWYFSRWSGFLSTVGHVCMHRKKERKKEGKERKGKERKRDPMVWWGRARGIYWMWIGGGYRDPSWVSECVCLRVGFIYREERGSVCVGAQLAVLFSV